MLLAGVLHCQGSEMLGQHAVEIGVVGLPGLGLLPSAEVVLRAQIEKSVAFRPVIELQAQAAGSQSVRVAEVHRSGGFEPAPIWNFRHKSPLYNHLTLAT